MPIIQSIYAEDAVKIVEALVKNAEAVCKHDQQSWASLHNYMNLLISTGSTTANYDYVLLL